MAGKLHSITSAQAQKIESAISKELQHAAHKDVKTLSNEEKGNIVSSVLDEVNDKLKFFLYNNHICIGYHGGTDKTTIHCLFKSKCTTLELLRYFMVDIHK